METTHKPDEAERATILSDYAAARLEYEERAGPYKTRINNLLRIVGISLVSNLLLTGGLVWTRQKDTIVPYVAVLDTQGHVLGIALSRKLTASERGAVLSDQIDRWLHDVRTVLTDWPAQVQMVRYVMERIKGPAEQQLRQWYTEHRPDDRARAGTVLVAVNVKLPRSESTYDVEWTETQYDLTGQQTESHRWKATLTVSLDPPHSLDTVPDNAVGFHVTNVQWSQVQ